MQTSYLSGMLNSAEEHKNIAAAAIGRDKRLAVRLITSHLEKTAKMLEGIEDLWVVRGSGP